MGNQAACVGRSAEERKVPEDWDGEEVTGSSMFLTSGSGEGRGASDSLREGKPKSWRKVCRGASDGGPNCRELETCLGDDGNLLRKARQKHLL